MKVLGVLHYAVFGGPSNLMMRLSHPLCERGVELAVVLPNEAGNAAARFRAAEVPIELTSLKRMRASFNPAHHASLLFNAPGDVGRLRQIIRRRGVDVVVLHGLANPHAAIAARREGRAVLWQIVDSRVPAPGRRALMPFVERLSDTVMFWGEAVRQLHTRGRTLAMPTLLANPPVDLDRFVPSPERRVHTRAELDIPAGARVVGTVANLNPQKGVEYFVRAAKRVAAHLPDAWFLVVGGRYDTHRRYARRLATEVRKSGVSDRFRFVGTVADVERYYPAMDVKLITSVPASEGIATTAVEAMACGVPVVTTDVGSAGEAVIDGVTGYVVPPLDDRALATAALRVLADHDAAARLGGHGRRRAEQHYGIEPCVDQHMRAFRSAIEHRDSRLGARGGGLG